jgi:hypothetical protein
MSKSIGVILLCALLGPAVAHIVLNPPGDLPSSASMSTW